MEIKQYIWILFLLASVVNSSVTELNADNIDTAIKSHKILMIKFYVPWCPHCKKLGPKYEKAARILQKDGLDSLLASVDCNDQREVCTRFKVTGYPTVLVFKDGENKEYEGSYSAKRMAKFVLENQ